MLRNRNLLVGAYLGVAALTVALGGALLWLHVSPAAPTGSIEVLAGARAPEHLPSAPVRIHSTQGWLELTPSAGGEVPAAPESLTLARRAVPARFYDALEVGGAQLAVSVTVPRGQVQPLLVEVAGGRPNPSGVYAGAQEVSLGINELAGRLLAVPPFNLVDQAGRAFDNSTIAGHDVVVAAFHTECHTTCPLYTGLFLQLQQRLPAGTMLVQVTTDPTTDTPQVLRAYAASIDARWTFATGDAAAVADFWKTFSVQLSNGEVHSSTLVVIDRHGFMRQPYQGVPRLDQPLDPQLRSQLNPAGQSQLAAGGDGWGASQILDALSTIGSQLERSTAAGGPAPEFSAQDPSGAQLSLAEFRGRPVVLNFWATWCDPCRREMPLLQRTLGGRRGVAAILVAEGDDGAHAGAFASGLGVSLPIAVDRDLRIGAAYKVGGGLPTTYFIKADGSIEGRYLGELDQATLTQHLAAVGVG